MRFSALFVFPLLAAANKHKNGPEVWGSHNCVDDCEMHQAIYCLQENLCCKGQIPEHGKARCTVGKSVAYICDYRGKHDNDHHCDVHSMYHAWDMIRATQNSTTGWYHDGEITYGFDQRCKHHECDNGWKEGSQGDMCSNMRNHKENTPWLVDFECDAYPGYKSKWEHEMTTCGDRECVVRPWQQGKRPQ